MHRELRAQYRAAMRRRGLAETTITKRSAELGRWLAFIGVGWPRATRGDVERWIDSRPLSVRTRYVAISNLAAFYRWAERESICQANPTSLVERPRLPRTVPRPARRAQVDVAIGAADTNMAATLVLMADLGLRCCEVACLRWSDVDLAEGLAYVRGKGSHERMVGIPERAGMVLSMLATMCALDDASDPAAAVVQPAATAAGISHRVRRYLGAQGLDCSAHQLRHLYATRLLAATGDLTMVQQALGHASIATTAGYAAVDTVAALRAARALD